MNVTAVIVGLVSGLATFALGRWVGFDRQRSFYPVVLIVVATYYILFGAMAGSPRVVLIETIFACGFIALAVLGFRYDLWLIAAGLVGHGISDLFHSRIVLNPGVPPWWPAFCSSIDVALGAAVVWLLMRGLLTRRPSDSL